MARSWCLASQNGSQKWSPFCIRVVVPKLVESFLMRFLSLQARQARPRPGLEQPAWEHGAFSAGSPSHAGVSVSEGCEASSSQFCVSQGAGFLEVSLT